jgi:hypothetical protein
LLFVDVGRLEVSTYEKHNDESKLFLSAEIEYGNGV